MDIVEHPYAKQVYTAIDNTGAPYNVGEVSTRRAVGNSIFKLLIYPQKRYQTAALNAVENTVKLFIQSSQIATKIAAAGRECEQHHNIDAALRELESALYNLRQLTGKAVRYSL